MNISTRIIKNILKNSVVIFLYHDVSNKPSPFSKKYNVLNISPDIFYSQVKAINNLFNIISPTDLIDGDFKRPAALFTFDDGYRNYIDNALPILDQYSFKSIVFLIAKNLNDKSGKYISSNDLKLLVKHTGVTVGAHGYSHVDLSSLSDEHLARELEDIREVFNPIGFGTNYFSLPFGRANDNVISELVEQGYTDIFTSDYGSGVINKNGKNIYPRIDIWSDDSDNIIKQKIMQYWKLFFIIESYRSKLYRVN